MNVSEGVQVFVLIYVLVIVALFVTARFWSPALGKVWRALGFSTAKPTTSTPAVVADAAVLVSHSFRPGAPRPPRLKEPPSLASLDAAGLRGYGHRLGLCAQIVGFVATHNPTGFPIGLFREWYEARWMAVEPACGVGAEQYLGEALRAIPTDEAGHDAVVARFASEARYVEMADLVHFCGQAFAASRAGSPVHDAVVALSDRLAVAGAFGGVVAAPADEEERSLLELKLEVDFLETAEAKHDHLRRMHGFFRRRLVELRDDPQAERRAERMADCRRHLEEHEKLLAWLGSSV
jgi:hypothetical protein